MGQIVDVTSTPWIDSGDAPPLALDRDKRDIISQGIADPLVDYDIVPLTYTNSRWSAFFYRASEKDLKHVLPKCLDLEDDVIEFWYVDHLHTGLGPYGEFGLTVAASHKDGAGKTWKAGYYPYMYLTQDAAVFAGREPFGFPKKIAYIVCQEHGGKEDDGYGGFGNDYFNFTMERRGYLIHTATGRYDDSELSAKPAFYGDPDYGRMNLRLITDCSLKTTKWDLTYLPSEVTAGTAAAMGRPETEGQHRFQLKPESIRTASADAIRSWALQATPWDNMGAMLPVKELIGLMSFNFDLIIPGADTIWTQTIERTDEDIGDLLFATPYQYTMRHRFPKPPGV
ncbi:MAG: acetoacetate decarboxylase family protein [Actinomycetota bacterium]|nr:acetoacetate decarboxylase family protein [Actinomycetota bacterium]